MILSVLFSLLFAQAVFAGPAPEKNFHYRFDQEQSKVDFTLKHLGIITVSGHFGTFSGTFRFDPENIEATNVHIAIQAASVASGNEARDAHLVSEKFFDATRHPQIRFKSRRITDLRDGHFNIEGNLTIHGLTRPAVFETELLTAPEEVGKSPRISFHAHTYIRRKDYRLGTGGWTDPIMLVTDETLKISLEVEGIRS